MAAVNRHHPGTLEPKIYKVKDRQTDLPDRDEGEGSKEGTKKTGLQ